MNGITQNKTTQYHYNAHRLDSVSYDDALTTIYHYNAAGQPDSVYDESGVMCYEYGDMGEVTQETRIYALPFLTNPLALSTQFTYDSWGRIQSITYPDNEVVSYAYDLGGQLQSITNNSSYTYLDNVTYDRFGAKVSQEYGNGIATDYTYDNTTRRLSAISTTNNGSPMSNIGYLYDLVGNVTQVTSTCPWLNSQTFTETFTYDASDQLVSASETNSGSYQLAVTYGNWGKINSYSLTQTDLQHNVTTQVSRSMTYPSNINNIGNSQTMFAPTMENGYEGVDYTFGINGSLRKREVQHPTQYTEYYLFNSAANLKAYSNNGLDFAYYGYNAANTRSYKLSMLNQNQWVNGQPEPLNLQLQSAMFYPNAYINFNQNGEYTKHYYNGSERIASRLGDNQQTIEAEANDRLLSRIAQTDELFKAQIGEMAAYEEPAVNVPARGTGEGTRNLLFPTVGYDPIPAFTDLQPTGNPDDIFYYHTNHLGSTAFVTDQNQNITQGFLYAPFGEITTEFDATFGNDIIPKYSFNAKELDEETGMYYYEARYYAPPVFTSRDPLMSEKPWLTPYHYCSNNPVGRVDPSGMLDEENPYLIFNGKTNKLQIWDDGNTPDNYDDDRFLGEYDAHNNVTSDSKGKWEDGIYNMLDKNSAHKHGNLTDKNNVQLDSPNGSYGVDGCFRAEPFHETTTNETREGMAVHAGREHLSFLKRKTLGCVRTTPKAMKGIIKAIKEYGPLQKIIIQNNRTSLNSEKANSIAPHNARVLPLFDPSIIPIVLPDKVRVAHIIISF